jgi:hypothetical protein
MEYLLINLSVFKHKVCRIKPGQTHFVTSGLRTQPAWLSTQLKIAEALPFSEYTVFLFKHFSLQYSQIGTQLPKQVFMLIQGDLSLLR